MSRNAKGNWPMQRRANYGGAGGEARPDEKMSRRKRKDWPYFNLGTLRAYYPGNDQVTTSMRQVLKHVSKKKRRQRDNAHQHHQP